MKPILFPPFSLPLIGEVTFPAYFTLLTVGFAMAMWITVRESRKIGLDREVILDANLWMVVWGIIGARVLHVIADGHFMEYVHLCTDPKLVPAVDAKVTYCTMAEQCGYDYLCDAARHVCYPPRDCLAALKVWRGGLAYYGGFIFAVPFGLWYARKHKLNMWRTADLSAPAISLGLFFGRLGCYLNGCCYGKETSSPVGVVFPRFSPAWRAQYDAGLIKIAEDAHAVHPTQLYESFACITISAILYFVVRPNKRRDGEMFGWFLILYAVARSLIEIFRDDDRGVFLGGWISTSQIISIPMLAAGLWQLWRLRRAALAEAPTATAV